MHAAGVQEIYGARTRRLGRRRITLNPDMVFGCHALVPGPSFYATLIWIR